MFQALDNEILEKKMEISLIINRYIEVTSVKYSQKKVLMIKIIEANYRLLSKNE